MIRWQLVGSLLLIWVALIVLMYMLTRLSGFSSDATASPVKRQLKRAMEELETLHSQNVELQNLAIELKKDNGDQEELIKNLESRFQKATKDLENGKQLFANKSPLRLNREQARRKVQNTATELWYFVNAKMKELEKVAGDDIVKMIVKNMKESLQGYQTVMVDDFKALQEADGDEEWRKKESLKYGDLVQRRLEYLQNPPDCKNAKYVICDHKHTCGFGCELHHMTYCLIVAYATERTLVLSNTWRDEVDVGESIFMPLSNTCTEAFGSTIFWDDAYGYMDIAKVIQLPEVEGLDPQPEYLPLAIPADLAPHLNTFHGDAPVWWIGHMVRYLMRPNKQLQQEIRKAVARMKFNNPIVGVHIRRTDKLVSEAAFHSLTEYMQHVEAYFNQREHREFIKKRRVYLATDDPTVLECAKNSYPTYDFISDNDISKSASLDSRQTESSLRGVILDIHFLSHSDFLVCTFSSQVCRLAYELMQTYHGDASSWFRSLDDVFYFGGQNAHSLRAVENHTGDKHELSFRVGDLLDLAGNHWDGFSKGTHRPSRRDGLFPSFKVVNNIVAVKMPTYPEVKVHSVKEDKEQTLEANNGENKGVPTDPEMEVKSVKEDKENAIDTDNRENKGVPTYPQVKVNGVKEDKEQAIDTDSRENKGVPTYPQVEVNGVNEDKEQAIDTDSRENKGVPTYPQVEVNGVKEDKEQAIDTDSRENKGVPTYPQVEVNGVNEDKEQAVDTDSRENKGVPTYPQMEVNGVKEDKEQAKDTDNRENKGVPTYPQVEVSGVKEDKEQAIDTDNRENKGVPTYPQVAVSVVKEEKEQAIDTDNRENKGVPTYPQVEVNGVKEDKEKAIDTDSREKIGVPTYPQVKVNGVKEDKEQAIDTDNSENNGVPTNPQMEENGVKEDKEQAMDTDNGETILFSLTPRWR